MNELEMFLSAWDREAENTVKLLKALPVTQYDFRPDKDGRSLGELAWHLAERPGVVVSRERLLERVWGLSFPGGTRTVDVHVGQLRR